jgi:hypothetical protein
MPPARGTTTTASTVRSTSAAALAERHVDLLFLVPTTTVTIWLLDALPRNSHDSEPTSSR